MLRIISGRYKGRMIYNPEGIRATQNKVRKALFDILGKIEGLSFLDLYAGSGAVGLEAFSRGVRRVVFVENNIRCIGRIKNSVVSIGQAVESEQATYKGSGCRIIGLDISAALSMLARNKEKFDIIFLDPPYYRDLVKKTLKMLSRCDILSPNGLIICQHFKKDNLPVRENILKLFKQARYGDTVLSFYCLQGR